MNKPKIFQCARLAVVCLITAASALRGITLTGNVEADFVSPEATIVTDGVGPDVGLPPMWPFATSGWDIKDVRFVYDRDNDCLYVGINFFGIAGDADGDGNPSVSAPALTANGGTDVATLGQTEAIQILFDWNEDGVFDTIAGVPTDAAATAFSIAPDVSPGLSLPADSARFGIPVANLEPFVGALNATAPDFEFKIPDVSTLPGFDAVSGFKFRAYAGSAQDDGIGEDFVGDSAALHVDLPELPAAPVVSLTELIVSRSHFNFWGTAVGEGGIARVEYKSDQKRWTRFERAKGTASWRFNIRRDGYQSLRVVIRAINTAGDASPEMVVEIQP
ncbi:MAG TPA: hypothetical protein VIT00_15230 [Terrimicrobiaceae bacterium]